MAKWTEELHELCEKITDEITDANKKLEKNGGKMTAGDLDYIDKLTHALKSIKTTIAMEEYDDDDYSGARGRGTYARRDSMGRYSRDRYMPGYDHASGRYSREDSKAEIMDHLHELERTAKDDHTRRMVQSWIRQAESE